jgi:hypothetical protein
VLIATQGPFEHEASYEHLGTVSQGARGKVGQSFVGTQSTLTAHWLYTLLAGRQECDQGEPPAKQSVATCGKTAISQAKAGSEPSRPQQVLVA